MKTIVILGMHRSATSMIARCMHQNHEVHMGSELLLGQSDNPKGHYENKAFLNLNIDILRAAGGSWQRPPAREEILKLEDQFRSRVRGTVSAERLKAKNRGFFSWGFKDPRTVLTLDLKKPNLKSPHSWCSYPNQKLVEIPRHR